MGTPTKFLSDEAWREVTALVRKAKSAHVAVAYLTNARLLPLRRGSTLVVDMSTGVVKSGQTNPSEIDKLRKRGVQVFTCTGLHAKVFVFDGTAVVGSQNASTRSKKDLIEASFVTRSAGAVRDARGFVKSLATEVARVSPKYIAECKKIYRPPQFPQFKEHGGLRGVGEPGSRVWVAPIYEFSEDEEREREVKEAFAHAAAMPIRRGFIASPLRFTDKSYMTKHIARGDQMICVWADERPIAVEPPARVLKVRRRRVGDSLKAWVYLEVNRKLEEIRWRPFVTAVRRAGLTSLKPLSTRALTRAAARAALGCWD